MPLQGIDSLRPAWKRPPRAAACSTSENCSHALHRHAESIWTTP